VTLIAFKVMVVIVTALLGAGMLRWAGLATMPERRFLAMTLGIQLIPAMIAFIVLYVIGSQEVPSDVPGYYVPGARAVLAGQMPYRDFAQSYAPLFPYLGAALLFLWNSGKMFVLFAISLNAVALVLWHRTALARFDKLAARQTSVLYATSGHVVLQTLLGTNQIWIATALAGSALLMVRGRAVSSGLPQALAACTTKLLDVLFWPVFWICAPRRTQWLLLPVLLSASVYGLFVIMGADVLDPVHREGDRFSSGNLPYLLEPLFAAKGYGYLVFDTLAAAAVAGSLAWTYLQARSLAPQKRPQLLLAALALVGLIFMAFSKKSISGYAVFFMYPAVLVAALGMTNVRARVGFLFLFNLLLALEPTLWFRVGRWRALSAWLGEQGGVEAACFVLMDVALVASYLYLAWLSAMCVRHVGGPESAEWPQRTCAQGSNAPPGARVAHSRKSQLLTAPDR
jgi:hypothetical protein